MTPASALREGFRRTMRAPWLWLGLYAVLLGLALPLALVLRGMIAAHLGASLAAERAASGVNLDWWHEFLAQASGIGATFTPSIVGFGGTLRNLSDFADRAALPPILVAIIAVHLALQTFLSGGVLDRLARDRPLRAAAFFAACGGYGFRLLRLNALGLLLALLGLGALHQLLFGTIDPWVTREMATERGAFAVRAALYLAWAAPVVLLTIWFDYTRVRIVVEDRRSVLVALIASWRFMRRRPIRLLGLYLLNALIFLLLLAIYAFGGPGGGSGWPIGLTVGLTQGYVVVRLVLRLVSSASQVAFFQGELAHAAWVAAPTPEWPESPAAEAVQ